jgi:hypothetical protein
VKALGFVRVTERGRGGNADYCQPNLLFLTFAHGRDSRANPPSHDWRKIKTLEEAMEIAKVARQCKDERAVEFRPTQARKNRKPAPEIGTGAGTENRYWKRTITGTGNRYYRVSPFTGTTIYISGWGRGCWDGV